MTAVGDQTQQINLVTGESIPVDDDERIYYTKKGVIKAGTPERTSAEAGVHWMVQKLLGNRVVVKLLEQVNLKDGRAGLLLEQIVGESLIDWRPNNLQEVIAVFDELARYITLAHCLGIVNLDLNHGGLIVTLDQDIGSNIKLLDLEWVTLFQGEIARTTPYLSEIGLSGTPRIANPALYFQQLWSVDCLDRTQAQAIEIYAFVVMLLDMLLDPEIRQRFFAPHIDLDTYLIPEEKLASKLYDHLLNNELPFISYDSFEAYLIDGFTKQQTYKLYALFHNYLTGYLAAFAQDDKSGVAQFADIEAFWNDFATIISCVEA